MNRYRLVLLGLPKRAAPPGGLVLVELTPTRPVTLRGSPPLHVAHICYPDFVIEDIRLGEESVFDAVAVPHEHPVPAEAFVRDAPWSALWLIGPDRPLRIFARNIAPRVATFWGWVTGAESSERVVPAKPVTDGDGNPVQVGPGEITVHYQCHSCRAFDTFLVDRTADVVARGPDSAGICRQARTTKEGG